MADNDRPRIPSDIKRQVRQRCGFGCVICGRPLYQYDHLVPWSEVEEHEPDNLVLLCDQHHREKTSGLLPIEQVIEANEAPANLATGVSSPYDLHYGGHDCEALIGSNVHTWPQMHDGLITVPVLSRNAGCLAHMMSTAASHTIHQRWPNYWANAEAQTTVSRTHAWHENRVGSTRSSVFPAVAVL